MDTENMASTVDQNEKAHGDQVETSRKTAPRRSPAGGDAAFVGLFASPCGPVSKPRASDKVSATRQEKQHQQVDHSGERKLQAGGRHIRKAVLIGGGRPHAVKCSRKIKFVARLGNVRVCQSPREKRARGSGWSFSGTQLYYQN